MYGMDNVNGVVIGDITIISADLYTPNGTQYGNRRQFTDYSEAVRWAAQARLDAIAEVGESEARRLNWLSTWELRTR